MEDVSLSMFKNKHSSWKCAVEGIIILDMKLHSMEALFFILKLLISVKLFYFFFS